jgi:hypothetical protein
VNRALVRYLRLLRALGLPETLVRRWAWWFTQSRRAAFAETPAVATTIDSAELCPRMAPHRTLLGRFSVP